MEEKLTPESSKRTFTDAQITQVKGIIAKNPLLARKLIKSALGGNQVDLKFISEAGIVVSDDETTAELIVIPDKPATGT